MSTLKQTFDFGILGEREVEVTYKYSPGTPDVMYLPNGDPGYPGDPAELEILDVTLDGIRILQWVEDNDDFITTVADEAAAIYEDRNADREDHESSMREWAEEDARLDSERDIL